LKNYSLKTAFSPENETDSIVALELLLVILETAA
jgi:hypothetical protein